MTTQMKILHLNLNLVSMTQTVNREMEKNEALDDGIITDRYETTALEDVIADESIVLNDGHIIGRDELTASEDDMTDENTNDPLSHIDEIIESVVSGAGNAYEPTSDVCVGLLRGFNNYFYGRQTKLMMKQFIPPYRWRKIKPNNNVRARQHNIFIKLPGIKNAARLLGDNPPIEEV